MLWPVFHSPLLHMQIQVVESIHCCVLLCSSSWGAPQPALRQHGFLSLTSFSFVLYPFFLVRICYLGFLMFLILQAVLSPTKILRFIVCITPQYFAQVVSYMWELESVYTFLCFVPFFFILKHFFSVCFLVFPGPANQKDEEVKLHKCILKKDADPALMPSRLNGIELRPLLVLKQNSFSK